MPNIFFVFHVSWSCSKGHSHICLWIYTAVSYFNTQALRINFFSYRLTVKCTCIHSCSPIQWLQQTFAQLDLHLQLIFHWICRSGCNNWYLTMHTDFGTSTQLPSFHQWGNSSNKAKPNLALSSPPSWSNNFLYAYYQEELKSSHIKPNSSHISRLVTCQITSYSNELIRAFLCHYILL